MKSSGPNDQTVKDSADAVDPDHTFAEVLHA